MMSSNLSDLPPGWLDFFMPLLRPASILRTGAPGVHRAVNREPPGAPGTIGPGAPLPRTRGFIRSVRGRGKISKIRRTTHALGISYSRAQNRGFWARNSGRPNFRFPKSKSGLDAADDVGRCTPPRLFRLPTGFLTSRRVAVGCPLAPARLRWGFHQPTESSDDRPIHPAVGSGGAPQGL